MSRWSRLLCAWVLLLQAAAPLAAYAYTPGLPDFGALCSATRALAHVPEPVGSPLPHSGAGQHVHCALCGGASGPALPGPSVAFAASPLSHVAPPSMAGAHAVAPAPPPTRARGPPLPA